MTVTPHTDRCSRACIDRIRTLLAAEEAQTPPSVAQSVVPRPPVSMTTTEKKLMASTARQSRAARASAETRTVRSGSRKIATRDQQGTTIEGISMAYLALVRGAAMKGQERLLTSPLVMVVTRKVITSEALTPVLRKTVASTASNILSTRKAFLGGVTGDIGDSWLACLLSGENKF